MIIYPLDTIFSLVTKIYSNNFTHLHINSQCIFWKRKEFVYIMTGRVCSFFFIFWILVIFDDKSWFNVSFFKACWKRFWNLRMRMWIWVNNKVVALPKFLFCEIFWHFEFQRFLKIQIIFWNFTGRMKFNFWTANGFLKFKKYFHWKTGTIPSSKNFEFKNNGQF